MIILIISTAVLTVSGAVSWRPKVNRLFTKRTSDWHRIVYCETFPKNFQALWGENRTFMIDGKA